MLQKRFLGLIALILGIYLLYVSGKSVLSLWGASSRIENAQRNLTAARKENNELKKRLAYVKSREYLEKEARDRLNLSKEGETVVVLPSVIPLLKTQEAPLLKDDIPNWKKWYRLFAE